MRKNEFESQFRILQCSNSNLNGEIMNLRHEVKQLTEQIQQLSTLVHLLVGGSLEKDSNLQFLFMTTYRGKHPVIIKDGEFMECDKISNVSIDYDRGELNINADY